MLTKTTNITWSYTLLKTYRDICPHQCYRRMILKDIPFVETEAMAHGNLVHTAMERRIGKGISLPMGMEDYEKFCSPFDERVPAVEQKLAITRDRRICGYWDDAVWGRGRLDVAVIEGSTGYIADHKTGKVREDPFELEVQAVLLHAQHPQLTRIVGQYFWLKDHKLGPLHDLSHTTITWNEINRIMQQIERCRQEGLWEKRQSPLCKWCDVRDCEYNRRNVDG